VADQITVIRPSAVLAERDARIKALEAELARLRPAGNAP